jgi:hypothetical protein
MSAGVLGAGIGLHGTLDHRDHGNALVERERADTLMKFGQDLEIELQPFGRTVPRSETARAAHRARSGHDHACVEPDGGIVELQLCGD